jgi:hypothetical protein
MKVKAEYGVSGDATLQATRDYMYFTNLYKVCHTILSSAIQTDIRRQNKERYNSTNFPAILIGLMGNVLEVSTLVALDIVHFNKILHFEIRGGDDQDKTVMKLLLIASALKECADGLKEEYNSLATYSLDYHTLTPERKWDLPCPTPKFSRGETPFDLDFKCKLGHDNVGVIPRFQCSKGKDNVVYHA